MVGPPGVGPTYALRGVFSQVASD